MENNLKIGVIKNKNAKLGQVFYKGKMITVEYIFDTVVMTKGNRVYSECGKFAPIPKTLKSIYNQIIEAIENN